MQFRCSPCFHIMFSNVFDACLSVCVCDLLMKLSPERGFPICSRIGQFLYLMNFCCSTITRATFCLCQSFALFHPFLFDLRSRGFIKLGTGPCFCSPRPQWKRLQTTGTKHVFAPTYIVTWNILKCNWTSLYSLAFCTSGWLIEIPIFSHRSKKTWRLTYRLLEQ